MPRSLYRAREVASPYSDCSALLSFAAHAASSHDFQIREHFTSIEIIKVGFNLNAGGACQCHGEVYDLCS